MGCVYHPHQKATAVCDQCKGDLCESCAVLMKDGRTLCHRCVVALSLEDVKTEATRRTLQQEARRLGLVVKWRPTYIQAVLAAGAVLLVLLMTLRLHWSEPMPQRTILLDPERPISVLGNLQIALEQYALTHDGSYPYSLYDLLPRFLDDSVRNRRVIRHLSYTPDEEQGFLVKIKDDAPFPGKELVCTTRGVRPSVLVPPEKAGEQMR